LAAEIIGGIFFELNETNWIRTQTAFVSQSEVTNDHTCKIPMLGTSNCPFKGESNLFVGGAFSFVLSL
jgi:hypothetical protein